MHDLIVIGAGPSGVSACLYAVARGMKVALFEKDSVGGLIGNVSTVSHYTALIKEETGESIASRMKSQLENIDIDIYKEEVLSVDLKNEIKIIKTNTGEYKAKSVIIAAGSSPKVPEIKNDENLEIHYNTTKYAQKYIGKEVFVNGGSDGAAKEAIYLSKFAKKVHIIQIADKILCIDEFKKIIDSKDNIDIHLDSSLTEIKGNSGKINYVSILKGNGELLEYCSEDDEFGVFAYIGQVPNSSIFEDALEIEGGYIKTNDEVITGLKGVFAVGDIRTKTVRQVATAVNDGAIAAIKAFNYINTLK